MGFNFVGSVIGAVVGFVEGGPGGALAGFLGGATTGAVVGAVLGGYLLGRIAQKPMLTTALQNRTIVLKSATAPRNILYGRCCTSGVLVNGTTNGTSNNFLHLVITLAGHQVTAIEDIYLNTKVIGGLSSVYIAGSPGAPATAPTYNADGSVATNGTPSVPAVGETQIGQVISGVLQPVVNEIGVILATSYQFTVKNSATFVADKGVVFGANNIPLIKVTGTPVAGQYRVSAGVYTFAASDTGKVVLINYTWTNNTYNNLLVIAKHLGSPMQAADSLLVSANVGWTNNHRLRGIAYLYLRLTFNQTTFSAGVPNVSAVVRGKPLYDPRAPAAVMHIFQAYGGNPAIFYTSTANGFAVGDMVYVCGATESAWLPVVDGEYWIGSVTSSTNFTLLDQSCNPVVLTSVGMGGNGATISKMLWSDNWALCVRDYLASAYGLKCNSWEIDDASVIDSANNSDEIVPLCLNSGTFYNNGGTPYISVPQSSPPVISTGDRIVFSSTGVLPTPLVAGTVYYRSGANTSWSSFDGLTSSASLVLSTSYANALNSIGITLNWSGAYGVHTAHITGSAGFTVDADNLTMTLDSSNAWGAHLANFDVRTGDQLYIEHTGYTSGPFSGVYYAHVPAVGKLQLSTSIAEALAGTVCNCSFTGTGFHSVNLLGRRRYTCNGTFTTDKTPQSILNEMLTAGAGMVVFTQGLYRILSGKWRAPDISDPGLTEDDLRGALQVNPRLSLVDLFNEVRGTYCDPINFWQPSDFPPVGNQVYVTQDGGQVIPNDLILPYTTDDQTAQRIAKILLERSRQGISVTFPGKLTLLNRAVGDVVPLSIAWLGWVKKPFIIMKWSFSQEGGIDLLLMEEAPTNYDWNLGDASIRDAAPDTQLPNPSVCQPPSALVANVGDFMTTGSVMLSWSASPDYFVDHYELQYKLQEAGDYSPLPPASGTSLFVETLKPGTWLFQVRAVSRRGVTSDWTAAVSAIISVPVISDVSGLTLVGGTLVGSLWTFSGRDAKFKWNNITAPATYYLTGGSNTFAPPLWFRDYKITVFSGSTVLRVEYSTDPFYTYTWEKNVEDNTGTPVRTFTLIVEARGIHNQLSPGPAFGLTVSNPAPAAP